MNEEFEDHIKRSQAIHAELKKRWPEMEWPLYYSMNQEFSVKTLDDKALPRPSTIVLKRPWDNWEVELVDPTNAEVLKAANQSIIDTEDYHHVFLEAIRRLEDYVFELRFGS